MAYIFKQKLNIHDLVNLPQERQKRVLIHEPEDYLDALYAYYLKGQNFDIRHCQRLESLIDSVKNFTPDILIFNVEAQAKPFRLKADWIFRFKKNFPEIFVITTGFNTDSEILKVLLSAGVSSHINRRSTRPQDIAVVVRNILQV